MATFTESFNKADGALGPDLTWSVKAGAMQVASNAATLAVDATRCVARAEADTGSDDMYAEMVVSTLTATNYVEVNVQARVSSDGATRYELRREFRTSTGGQCWELAKHVAGVETTIQASTVLAFSLPETWRLEVEGSTIRVLRNGSEVASFTDSSIPTGTHGGIGGYKSTVSRANAIDSFGVGSLAVAPPADGSTVTVTATAAGAGVKHSAGGSTVTVTASPDTDPFTTHFDGSSLPSGWAFDSVLGDGSVTVADSRATLACPATTHDSIAHEDPLTDVDQSVGITAPVPDHGGDIDIAVQIDSDLTDQIGQGVNLLATNASGDAVRFAIYMPDDTDAEYPSIWAYSRAGGSGAAAVNATYSRYMTGCPSFLRVKYTASTGVWQFLTSSDGVTWVSDWDRKVATGPLTITRDFAATDFKVGITNVATTMTPAALAVQRAVDLLTTGSTDLREPAPDRTPVTIATLDGSAGALSAPWTDDCAGTDTLTWTGTAVRLNHDATQDADTGARAAIGYTGSRHAEWGILVKLANPDGDTDCYLTISGSTGTGNRDQYRIGSGYGLEIQSGAIRRPIRIDDNSDATNSPVAPFPTDLNETPYYHLASHEAEYDLTLGGIRWVRMERVGSRYRVKEWADGSAEPSSWNLWDGQDQVIEDDLGPYISLSHNDVRTGLCKIDIYSVEFYALSSSHAASGGSTAPVTVTSEGAGVKASSGGAEEPVTVTTVGGGSKTAAGGSTAGTAAAASGAGVKHASGGSTVTVTAEPSGSGVAFRFGGSTAAVTVTATGGGRRVVAGAGGSTVPVTATPSGSGTKHAQGGSTVTVSTTATGGGHRVVAGRGGSVSIVTVTTHGAGIAHRLGGTTIAVTAAPTGAGVKRAAGGSTAVCTVTATGAGVNPNHQRDLTLTYTVGTDRWTHSTGHDRWTATMKEPT